MGMTIAQFKALKTKADTEWKRRKYNGSMASYADKEYTIDAAAGKPMRAADGNLVMTPFTAMVTHGNLATSSAGTLLQSSFDNNTIDTWLTALATRDPESSSNDCNAACSGLCVGQCATGCTGCTGTCTGDCTGCTGTCTGDCTGTCTGKCTGTCTGGCSGCKGCSGTCSGCSGCSSCAGAGTCGSSCTSCTSCSGCRGGCRDNGCTSCTSCNGCTGCSGGCKGTAKRWV